MAQNEDMGAEEGDEISGLLAASIESNSKPVEISPEDAAWVDSCLISEDNWDALREALLETLTAQVEETSDARVDEFAEEIEETSEFVQEAEIEQEPTLVTSDGGEDGEDNVESRDDIFKVWELETMHEEEEENELIKQLKKALTERKFQGSSQSASGDDKALEVDEIVAGIGDLSLESPSE